MVNLWNCSPTISRARASVCPTRRIIARDRRDRATVSGLDFFPPPHTKVGPFLMGTPFMSTLLSFLSFLSFSLAMCSFAHLSGLLVSIGKFWCVCVVFGVCGWFLGFVVRPICDGRLTVFVLVRWYASGCTFSGKVLWWLITVMWMVSLMRL